MTATLSDDYEALFYLDYNATTPVDPRVIAAMEPYFHSVFGNAASRHRGGVAAQRAAEAGREAVARLVGGRAQEVVFTSGATESNNLALIGTLATRGGHVVSVETEHPSVLDPLKHLETIAGVSVSLLKPDRHGMVDPEHVAAAIRPDTVLVSVMGANNELGTVSPMREIGRVCREAEVLFHCDGAQIVGRLPVDVDDAEIDLLSISAHKMYGPKGIGALYVRRGTPIVSILRGGGQERGLRSGTLNVPAIVGFGAAALIAADELTVDAAHCETLRALLLAKLREAFPHLEVNGHPTRRLPGTLNVRLPGVDADSLQLAAPRVAVSSGSACTSATPEPSHVLLAAGLTWQEAQQCIRFGVGRGTTEADVVGAVGDLHKAAARLGEGESRR